MTVEDGRIVRRALAARSWSGGTASSADPDRSAAADAAVDVASHAAQLADLLDAVDTGREPRSAARTAATRSRSSSPCTSRPASAAR